MAGDMSDRRKAATLCVILGPEISARMFRHLNESEIEQLTTEIAQCRQVTPDERGRVLQEFRDLLLARQYVQQGGIDYAKQVLEQAVGQKKATEILHRLVDSLHPRPFDAVRRTHPAQLASFIQNEHPQTVAMVLTYLPPDQAAMIVGTLSPERQTDVIRRMALMDRTSPEMLREAEQILSRKLSAVVQQDDAAVGGVEWVVSVLANVDRVTERTILGKLAADDPDLAEELKKRMFLFDDIVSLDDRSLQRVMRDVDLNKDLPLAMKTANEAVWQKVLANVSKRMADTLRENVDLLGPVRLRDVEEAQARIVGVIRRLEEMGEVVVTRGGNDEVLV